MIALQHIIKEFKNGEQITRALTMSANRTIEIMDGQVRSER
ncbi:MAG: hypothetical protein ACRC6X_02120 [Culicoidibacterales bacterium]